MKYNKSLHISRGPDGNLHESGLLGIVRIVTGLIILLTTGLVCGQLSVNMP